MGDLIHLQRFRLFEKGAVKENARHKRKHMKGEPINDHGNHRDFKGHVKAVEDRCHGSFHDSDGTWDDRDQRDKDPNGKADYQDARRNLVTYCDE